MPGVSHASEGTPPSPNLLQEGPSDRMTTAHTYGTPRSTGRDSQHAWWYAILPSTRPLPDAYLSSIQSRNRYKRTVSACAPSSFFLLRPFSAPQCLPSAPSTRPSTAIPPPPPPDTRVSILNRHIGDQMSQSQEYRSPSSQWGQV